VVTIVVLHVNVEKQHITMGMRLADFRVQVRGSARQGPRPQTSRFVLHNPYTYAVHTLQPTTALTFFQQRKQAPAAATKTKRTIIAIVLTAILTLLRNIHHVACCQAFGPGREICRQGL
jgi:hypothetical protein